MAYSLLVGQTRVGRERRDNGLNLAAVTGRNEDRGVKSGVRFLVEGAGSYRPNPGRESDTKDLGERGIMKTPLRRGPIENLHAREVIGRAELAQDFPGLGMAGWVVERSHLALGGKNWVLRG